MRSPCFAVSVQEYESIKAGGRVTKRSVNFGFPVKAGMYAEVKIRKEKSWMRVEVVTVDWDGIRESVVLAASKKGLT
jgi:hypothetical protein